VGDTPGQKILYGAKQVTKGKFAEEHLLGSGLNTLYEGSSVSYPNATTPALQAKGLHTFAQSTVLIPIIIFCVLILRC
jgi:hypothetical protein